MPVKQNVPAPYAPASVILNLISRHRARGLPTPINAEVLQRAGVSDSLVNRTLQALIILDLATEEGQPTQALENLRLAPEAQYQQVLGDWIKSTYADALQFVDPALASETEIRDAFRHYKPVGQQDRMVSLFLGLCEAAGLAPERKRKTPTPSATTKPVRAKVRSTDGFAQEVKPAPQRQPGTLASTGVPPALSGLLASLPQSGETWSKSDRDRFLHTFSAVLDFCFPVTLGKQQKPASVDEDDEA